MAGWRDRYDVEGRLGSGSTGTVWLARQRDLDRLVAVKELAPELASDPTLVDALRNEAQLLATLDHPHCVRIYAYLEAPGEAALVEEYVEGASLRAVLRQAGRLTPEQAVGVLEGALSGLGAAHAIGVVHGDIKPENILVDRQGRSRLVDFGMAGRAGARLTLGSGTAAYASPEAVQGHTVDARSDIYCCGAMLFELLVGQPPYRGESAHAVLAQHVNAPVPAAEGQPPAIQAVVATAMAKDPAARYPTADAFYRALQQAAEQGYGADWRSRSSLAAFVPALLGAAGVVGAGGIAGVVLAGGGAAGASAGAVATGGVASGVATGAVATGAATTAATGAAVGTSAAAAATAGGFNIGLAVAGVAAAVVVVGGAAVVVTQSGDKGHGASKATANLIVNGNAEDGDGSDDGSVVAVPAWSVGGDSGTFTAVKYGASGGYPTDQDPGPADRGKNFFAGGNSEKSVATQAVSLGSFVASIDDGKATFVVKGFLGGFSDQGDNATLEVSWQDDRGTELLHTTIGPVSNGDRSGATGLLERSVEGTVPKRARTALVQLTMVRTDGAANDGYADDLSLAISTK